MRINELGYISKTSLKEQIGLFFSFANGKNQTIQSSVYVSQIRKTLQIDQQFQFPEIFQPGELIGDELFEQLENCHFWVVVEVLSKLTALTQPLDELIFRFLGKIFDNLVPNKSSFTLVKLVCADITNIRNSAVLYTFIQKIYAHA